MVVRSRSQVKECIVSYFRDWLDNVDTKHCVFVVSSKPIQLRPTTTSDTDGGLLAKPQQVTLRSLFRELFPHAEVYEPASTQQVSAPGRGPSSVDLTVGFQTVGEPDFDASSLLQDVDDDASAELGALGRTRPWADAFGPEGESLAANIASLVEKTPRVSDFAKATFSTSEKQDTPVTTDYARTSHLRLSCASAVYSAEGRNSQHYGVDDGGTRCGRSARLPSIRACRLDAITRTRATVIP